MKYDERRENLKSEIQTKILSILSDYFGRLIEDYSITALQLNSFEIALNRYVEAPDDFGLNTIGRIPHEFQLETDMAMHYDKEGLIKHYRFELPRKVAFDYLVRTVSIIDAMFEDIYEYLLITNHPDLEEKKRANMVRSAWANENLRNYLITDFGLLKPNNRISTIEMTFDRYEELREVRHAIMHNKGNLSRKHKDRLLELKERMPKDMWQQKSTMLDTDMISGDEVTLNYISILNLRKWAYVLILYLRDSFIETLKSEG